MRTLQRGYLPWIRPAWVLTGFGLVLAVVTALYISEDRGICPPTDSEHHLFNALWFGRSLRLGGLWGLWESMRDAYVGWPPAAYVLLYGPLAWAFGEQDQLIKAYGLALVPLLMWGTFHLGRRLGGARAGTLAAILAVFSFGVSGQLRQVGIDLPATAALLLALAALLRTRAFSRPGATLLYGAACALCLFTRVQLVFFLAGPSLVMAVASLWLAPGWRQRLRRAGVLLLALLLTIGLSSPWWLGKLGHLWQILTTHLDPAQVQPRGDPEFLPGLWYYGRGLGRIAGWPVLLAALGLLPLLLRRVRGQQRVQRHLGLLCLVASVLGALVGLSAGVHREPRYMLPAVPLLALLAVLGLRHLGRRPRELLGAALLASTVAPTLWVAAHPVRVQGWAALNGVVEWGYTRRPFKLASTEAADQVAELLRTGVPDDQRGGRIYLFVVNASAANYLPRMGAFLLPRFPDLMFSFSNNLGMANSQWHVRQRQRREMFLLTETVKSHDLPLLWSVEPLRYRNPTPLRLYRVPPRHRLRGVIDRKQLYRTQTPAARPGARTAGDAPGPRVSR